MGIDQAADVGAGELESGKRSLVFNRGDGEPISTQNGRTLLRQALDHVGLRQHGPHSLRHTFCSHLAMRGAAARVIQQLAGHSSLAESEGLLEPFAVRPYSALRASHAHRRTPASLGSPAAKAC